MTFGQIGVPRGIPINRRITLNGVYIYFTTNSVRAGKYTPSGSFFQLKADPLDPSQMDFYHAEGGTAEGSLKVFGNVQQFTRPEFGTFHIPIDVTGMHVELEVTPTPR
jgi:hypothetical protein